MSFYNEIATITDITRRCEDINIKSYWDSDKGTCYCLTQGQDAIQFSMRELSLINSVINADQNFTNRATEEKTNDH